MDNLTEVLKDKLGLHSSNWLGQDLIWTQVCLITKQNFKDFFHSMKIY